MTFLKYFSRQRMVYLAMVAYVFVASTALASSKKIELPKISDIKIFNVSKLPVLKATPDFPVVSAQGAIAVDIDSGVVLYEKNPDAPLLPASTTKIMTALVALEEFDPGEVLEAQDPRVEGQKMGLAQGEKISFDGLLHGLLIYSANDAAMVLAQNYPGGVKAFVERMNAKALELNLVNTRFTNPVGLDGGSHRSTARDMIRLSAIAMADPYFAAIVGTKEKMVVSQSGTPHFLVSTNKLLGEVEGVRGVKTGWTENARENLVTYVERDNKKIILAVLGSQDRFGETRELIDWIFQNYTWTTVAFTK